MLCVFVWWCCCCFAFERTIGWTNERNSKVAFVKCQSQFITMSLTWKANNVNKNNANNNNVTLLRMTNKKYNEHKPTTGQERRNNHNNKIQEKHTLERTDSHQHPERNCLISQTPLSTYGLRVCESTSFQVYNVKRPQCSRAQGMQLEVGFAVVDTIYHLISDTGRPRRTPICRRGS